MVVVVGQRGGGRSPGRRLRAARASGKAACRASLRRVASLCSSGWCAIRRAACCELQREGPPGCVGGWVGAPGEASRPRCVGWGGRQGRVEGGAGCAAAWEEGWVTAGGGRGRRDRRQAAAACACSLCGRQLAAATPARGRRLQPGGDGPRPTCTWSAASSAAAGHRCRPHALTCPAAPAPRAAGPPRPASCRRTPAPAAARLRAAAGACSGQGNVSVRLGRRAGSLQPGALTGSARC
jgi:hypothetical protein